jgi:uncharacterized protein (TIGR02145 family)
MFHAWLRRKVYLMDWRNKRLHLLFFSVLLFCALNTNVYGQAENVFTDERDGREYKSVRIGNQTWMAENLAYLPEVYPSVDSRFEGRRYYVYGYDGNDLSRAKEEPSFQQYGVLYNWDAARESCPAGWHLPTDPEWKELERYLEMEAETDDMGWRGSGAAGEKLKSAAGWKADMGSDEFGFRALPAGCRGYDGFESMGYCAYFWTASPAGGDNGWRRGLCGDDDGIAREQDRRYFGISVRCIKDD